MNRVKEIADFVYSHFQKVNAPKDEKIYRWQHTLRVTNLALSIGKTEEANEKIVLASGLLHDIGRFDESDSSNYVNKSVEIARGFLTKLDYTDKEIDDVCVAILSHADGQLDSRKNFPIEAKVLFDAEHIDRNGITGVLNQTKIEEFEKLSIEQLKHRLRRLKDNYNVNVIETKTGKSIFKKNLKLQINFYTQLIKEREQTAIPQVKNRG